MSHTSPKLHNAMWPGLVGKGPDSEPPIDLDTMLDMTAKAEVNGIRFDGVDLFLFEPHTSIDSDDSAIQALADKIASKGLAIGSVVAPVWPPTGGGSRLQHQGLGPRRSEAARGDEPADAAADHDDALHRARLLRSCT